jgi:hypothetical protein
MKNGPNASDFIAKLFEHYVTLVRHSTRRLTLLRDILHQGLHRRLIGAVLGLQLLNPFVRRRCLEFTTEFSDSWR